MNPGCSRHRGGSNPAGAVKIPGRPLLKKNISTLWKSSYAQRMRGVTSSAIREPLKVTRRPEIRRRDKNWLGPTQARLTLITRIH
jgi:hypothetical protein